MLLKCEVKRLQIGDASTVFRSERPVALETGIVYIFGEPPKDDPDRNIRAIRAIYEAPKTGVSSANDDVRFYALGLAPNVARISVRFWEVSTVAGVAAHIRQHFDDLQIIRSDFDSSYFSLFRLLVSTATLGKTENILPNMAGDLMRSVLRGTPYPRSLLQSVIGRIR